MSSFTVKTVWMRGESEECQCCEGRHVFSRYGDVLETDFPSKYDHMQNDVSNYRRAISSLPEGAIVRVSFEIFEDTQPTEPGSKP